jgi:2-amino-4-hydroxy-6-hydroxymethyldihydropteridine diphosphokinase
MTIAYVGVGSNVERDRHSRAAIEELSKLDSQLRVSTIYECGAVGFDSAPFYNFVVELRTGMTLTEFSRCLRSIEFRWGRRKDATKYQDRTLDLDIILFGEQVSDRDPELPRSDIYKYPFVIQPLYELAPELTVPGTTTTIKQLWQQTDGLGTLQAVDNFYVSG